MVRNFILAGCCIVLGCGGGSGGSDGGSGDGGGRCGSQALVITITDPADGASGIAQERPSVTATLSRCLNDRKSAIGTLRAGNDVIPGGVTYSETNLDLVYQPFAMLESNTTYTLTLEADGAQASVTFTTATGYEGDIPPILNLTYYFNISEFSYPPDLVSVFQTIRGLMPPTLMDVVKLETSGASGAQTATMLLVGGAGDKTTLPPNVALLPETSSAKAYTSTAIHFNGRMRGRWFAIGPGVLHATASGVPLSIKDFLVTGLFSADGTTIELAYLTGVLNVNDLSEALGIELTVCEEPATKDACDADKNIRLAGKVTGGRDTLPFSCFIPTPLNKDMTVAASTPFDVYCSEAVDPAATTLTLRDCAVSDAKPPKETDTPLWPCYSESGTEVTGTIQFDAADAHHMTWTPTQALSASNWYRFGVSAGKSGGGATDARHVVFRTQ